MLSKDKVDKYNKIIMNRLSVFLNIDSDFIKKDMIEGLVNQCNLSEEEAYAIVLSEVCGFNIEDNDIDMEIYQDYFPYMIKCLNQDKYLNNAYYKNIKIPEVKNETWELKNQTLRAYEAFVYDDLTETDDGRVIPPIGFFTKDFKYPVVLQDNREWMLVTPNEVETMQDAIDAAKGKVLTYGLGLGYYAYMVSEKQEVSSITVVEKDERVIKLFNEYILPQFKHKDKVKVINEDAFTYAKVQASKENYDLIYADIWHDAGDGIDMYLKFKEYESLCPNAKFMYWIEKTMNCYLQ